MHACMYDNIYILQYIGLWKSCIIGRFLGDTQWHRRSAMNKLDLRYMLADAKAGQYVTGLLCW